MAMLRMTRLVATQNPLTDITRGVIEENNFKMTIRLAFDTHQPLSQASSMAVVRNNDAHQGLKRFKLPILVTEKIPGKEEKRPALIN
jgi:hypothetical protein